jgi:hypothetical protein
MPRITNETVSNADQAKELPEISKKARDLYWPAVSRPSR